MKKQISVSLLVWFLAALSIFSFSLAEASVVEKDWTMLVYLNGNSDLDEFGALNVNQMEKVGSDSGLNIVVQWASYAQKTTKRLLVTKDNDPSRVTSPIVEEFPDVDMGSKKTLLDFISWTTKRYPAKKYFVVVWNHGSGWHFSGPGPMKPTDISYDDKTGNHITTEELGEVMRDAAKLIGHKIDLYGSDACLMSMIEVAYEMNGAVEAFVGSEETEPGAGWPYDTFLREWREKKPNASALEVGKILAEKYGEYYADEPGQSTQSVLEMAKLPKLVGAMKKLGAKLSLYPDKPRLRKEVMSAVRFFDRHYADLGNAVGRVRGITTDPSTLAAIGEVQLSLKSLVYANVTNTKAEGLSIWWPTDVTDWSAYEERYKGLKFNKASGWHSFLGTFY